MIKIIENCNYTDISYQIQTINKDQIIDEYEIRCKSTTKNMGNKVYYLLFDRNYILLKSVFEYINVYQDNLRKSEQTKEKTLVALKFLYSFLNIFNIELNEMTSSDGTMLLTFLFGYSQTGNDFSMSFNSVRTASSVNDYLSIMRNFVKYLKYKNHPLLESAGVKKILRDALTGEMQQYNEFDIKANEYYRMQVPKHITLDEFKLLSGFVQSSKNKRLECIIRLMYESGLRSGEVLGLTFEDLKISKDDKNRDVYKVILRNRLSNKSWQSPKLLMKIKTKEEYMLKDYNQLGFGYENVYITKSLYDLLLEYIKEAHEEQQEKHYENWFKYCVTDKVDKDFSEENNFYLFVNSIGRPLSKKSLDTNIKELFNEVGVKVNIDGGKFDGLCHRFRHGFAMYQVTYNNTPLLLLKELMRHRNIKSTLIYYTPETSTIIKLKDELSKLLYEKIPEFDLRRDVI